MWRHVKGGIHNWQDPGFLVVGVGLLNEYGGMWRGEIRVFSRSLGSCVNVKVYKGGIYNWPGPGFLVVGWLLRMWRCTKEGSITDQVQIFLRSSACCENVKVHKGGLYNWPGPGFLEVVSLLCECESVLAAQAGLLTPLTFSKHRLSPLAAFTSGGCFYFWCILSSQWKAVTVNLRSLQCQL